MPHINATDINTPVMMLAITALFAQMLFYPRAPRLLRAGLAVLVMLTALSGLFWKVRINVTDALEIAIVAAVVGLMAVNVVLAVLWLRRSTAPSA